MIQVGKSRSDECPCGSPAVDSGLCADCINPPDYVDTCEHCRTAHWVGGPCPTQAESGPGPRRLRR